MNQKNVNWKYLIIVFFCVLISTSVFVYYSTKLQNATFPDYSIKKTVVSENLWPAFKATIFSINGYCDREATIDDITAKREMIDLNNDNVSEILLSDIYICDHFISAGANEVWPLILAFKKINGQWANILDFDDAMSYRIGEENDSGYSNIYISGMSHKILENEGPLSEAPSAMGYYVCSYSILDNKYLCAEVVSQ